MPACKVYRYAFKSTLPIALKIQYRQGKIHTVVMDFGSDDTPLGSHKGIAYQKCTLDLLDKPNFTSVLEDNPVHVWRVFEPFNLNALTAEHFNALVSSAVEVRLYHTSGNQYPFKQFMDYSIGSYYCAPLTPVMSSRQKAVKKNYGYRLKSCWTCVEHPHLPRLCHRYKVHFKRPYILCTGTYWSPSTTFSDLQISIYDYRCGKRWTAAIE